MGQGSAGPYFSLPPETRDYIRNEVPKGTHGLSVCRIHICYLKGQTPLGEEGAPRVEKSVLRIIDMGRFGSHPIDLKHLQSPALAESFIIVCLEIKTPEIKARDALGDPVNRMKQLRGEQFTAIKKKGTEGMGTQLTKRYLLPLGRD